MKMDILVTPDNYNIEDVLELGRCVVCGKLAGQFTVKDHKGRKQKVCGPHVRPECGEQLQAAAGVLDH